MKQRILLYLIALLLFPLCKVQAAHQPEFSTAGFYRLANSGRDVFSMNPAWRLHKGAAPGAEAIHFDDRKWEVVSLPNGIEYRLHQLSRGSVVPQTFHPCRCFKRQKAFPPF